MTEDAFTALPRLDAEAHIVVLGAVDPSTLELGLEQHIAGVEIADAHLQRLLSLRPHHSAAAVEIEAQTLGTFLGGHLSGRGIGGLDGRRRGGGCRSRYSRIRRRRRTSRTAIGRWLS